LLFGRDEKSARIGKSLGVDILFIQGFRDGYSPFRSTLLLQHFPIYQTRLQHIQKRMNEWRPQSFRELFIKPYRDPLSFYALQFASFVGVMTILGLGATLAQTYAAFKAIAMQGQLGG